MFSYVKKGLLMVGVCLLLYVPSVRAESDIWLWPVEGRMTDTFGTRGGQHYGIDIAAPTGTDVRTVASGEVTKSYYSKSYGNVIFIKHSNGYETVYAHLHTRNAKEGAKVKTGEVIGTLGNTGHSTGPHLHFEVHKGAWTFGKENAVNPLALLPDAEMVSAKEVKTYTVKKGDTLFHIAKKFDISVQQLKKDNDISSTNDTIYPMQKLQVASK
ncbi:M23 family metallopeptidase [Priestia taiwanensis]|uniref:Peptidase M23 n=1 Tax=Priestia taiwanensis TaxID=1347902 RepID=A0A917AJ09_9BACI|nr:M23 family metallopeptidase [Priestia taiwanensis]MBM7361598.1 murein DD-endopeptidase MepM/ murein hydrolase activator NlpD [Priestia taiwanensis]GGE55397.1 peptidase M23 [Priestia taiwanensis]